MKVNISRIFETSKVLATKAGQELQEFVTYVAEAITQIIVALKNALTFEDNFNCLISNVDFKNNAIQIVNTNGKMPKHVIITRPFNFAYPVANWAWQMNDSNQMVMKVGFANSPPDSLSLKLTLLILF